MSQAIPVFITDGYCASACLDFLDIGLYLPHALQLGLPTSADTLYMDIAEQPLSETKNYLFYPMKVYQNRPRKTYQVYVPNVRFMGSMADDQALQDFVWQELMEQTHYNHE